MIINEKYLAIGIERSAQRQIADEYRNKGYSVYLGKEIDNYKCDVYAENGDEKIAIEIKVAKISNETKKKYLKLAKSLLKHGVKLVLVVARLPPRKDIKFDGLSEILFDYLQSNPPDIIESMSTHSSISEVCDIDISSINIDDDVISVKGTATISVELQFGSSSDVENDLGMTDSDDVDLTFDVDIINSEISKIRKLKMKSDYWTD